MDPSQPGPSNAAYAFGQPVAQPGAYYAPPPAQQQQQAHDYAAYSTAPPTYDQPMAAPPPPPPPQPPAHAGYAGGPAPFVPNIASRPQRQRRKPARYEEPHHPSGPRPSKLKLNFSKKGAVGGRYSSFLGHYDREIDSDEEELEMEEHFILRMPGQAEADKLRALLKAKAKGKDGTGAAGKKGKAKESAGDENVEGVWFKFKDSRRAAFSLNGQLYSAKLVDLPSIIESQKTLDGKQMFKVADISQMLQVTHPISSEASVLEGGGGGNHSRLNIEEYIYPHGITPPLRHVRKRRYRKRVSRRTIEIVEEEVERLLDEDSKAEQSTYDIIENADPDASDTEFLTPTGTPLPGRSEFGDDSSYAHGHGGFDGSEMGDGDGDGMTSRFGGTDGGFEGGQGGAGGADGFDLAAELTRGLKALDESGEDEDEEDEDAEEDDEDEDDEDEEDDDDDGSAADSEDEEAVQLAQRQKLLNEEIRDLEAAVAKKRVEIEKSANVIIRKRFEDALKKLQADLDLKLSARATNVKEKEKRKREEEEEKEREQAFRDAEKERATEVALAAAASESRARQAQEGGDGGGDIAADDEDDVVDDEGQPFMPPPPVPRLKIAVPSAAKPAAAPAPQQPPPPPQQQQQPAPAPMSAQGIESLMAAGLDAESSGDDEDEDEEDLFGDDGTEDDDDEGSEASMDVS